MGDMADYYADWDIGPDDSDIVHCKFCGIACYWKEIEKGKWRLFEDLGNIDRDKLHVCKEYKRIKSDD